MRLKGVIITDQRLEHPSILGLSIEFLTLINLRENLEYKTEMIRDKFNDAS